VRTFATTPRWEDAGMTHGPIDPDATAVGVATERPAQAGMRRDRGLDILAVIALGGGIGSVARYLLATALPVRPGHFPWATFVTNVTGCLLLGALMVFVLEVWPPRRYVRPFAGVGVLGGFTTFSTFAVEVRGLAAHDAWALAAAYALSSLAFGVAAVWCGGTLARVAVRAARRERAA
jgi:fluoride exporter